MADLAPVSTPTAAGRRSARVPAAVLRAFAAALLAGAVVPSAHAEDGPSFDCSAAQSKAEQMVCADPKLAALDRRLSEVYSAATDALDRLDSGSEQALNELHALQRGWIKGRDDCWKAKDARACVEAAYLRREGELVARYMLRKPTSTVSFFCDGNRANEVTVFFFDTAQPSVRIEYGDSIDTGALVPAGSGARYEASFGRSISIKGDDATFVWKEGSPMACKRAS